MRTFIALTAIFALANFGTTQTATLRPVRITPPQIAGSTPVHNEPPANNGQTWVLLNAPLAGTEECHENGLLQTPGQSYTIAGAVITSPFWVATDTILCSYQH